MHDYCSNCVYLHTFAMTDVGFFLINMCKIKHFLNAKFCN